MKSPFTWFLLGATTGVLATLLVQRLADFDDLTAAEDLSDSLQDHLAELEARLGASRVSP